MPYDYGNLASPVETQKYDYGSMASPVDSPPSRQKAPLGLNTFGAIVEPVAAMGSAMLAGPFSDVAGLADIPLHAAGISKTMPEDVKTNVQRAMTYQPRTRVGQAVTQYNPLSLVGRGIGSVADAVKQRIAPSGTSSATREAFGNLAESGINALPMLLGGMAPKAAELTSAGLRGGAERLMHSALKPSITHAPDVGPAIDTLLQKGINVTPGGLEKLQANVDSLNDRIAKMIGDSPATIDKHAVATRLYDVMDRFEKQVDPHADLAAIEKSWENFMRNPLFSGKDIPIKTAQQVKQGTYVQLRKKYGELGSAETESQKALARGLKEEIAKALPEVHVLNAEESKLLSALPMVERRVIRSANKNPLGLSILALHPKNIAVWMADRSELFKSLIARMLNFGSQRVPPMNVAGPIGGMAMSAQANGPSVPPIQ